jgi:hypothetical protein
VWYEKLLQMHADICGRDSGCYLKQPLAFEQGLESHRSGRVFARSTLSQCAAESFRRVHMNLDRFDNDGGANIVTAEEGIMPQRSELCGYPVLKNKQSRDRPQSALARRLARNDGVRDTAITRQRTKEWKTEGISFRCDCKYMVCGKDDVSLPSSSFISDACLLASSNGQIYIPPLDAYDEIKHAAMTGIRHTPDS